MKKFDIYLFAIGLVFLGIIIFLVGVVLEQIDLDTRLAESVIGGGFIIVVVGALIFCIGILLDSITSSKREK